jgi:signal transduction histidine kinase/CheY-like chemotaxis protein
VKRSQGKAEARRAREQLEHLNQVLRAIRNVNQLIVREKDPARLAEQACALLIETRGYRGAWIALAAEDGSPGPVASAGCGAELAAFAEGLRAGRWPACRARALAAVDGLAVIDDAARCDECPLRAVQPPRATAVALLRHGEASHGLLGVASPRADFDAEERELLVEIALDLGFALDAMARRAEQRRAEALLRTRLALHEYAGSHELPELLTRTLDEVCQLVESPIGFYHFVETDQETISLQQWSTRTRDEFCRAEGEGLHYPIAHAGVWVDCVRERRPVIHNDLASLPHRKGMPEGHAEVRRELVVPVLRDGQIVAILGVGNKPTPYSERDAETVAYLADVTWSIVERRRNREALRAEHDNFRAFLNAAPAAILVFDEHEEIVLCNPTAERLFGDADRAVRCGDLLRCVHRREAPAGCGAGPRCPVCGLFSSIRAALAGETVEGRAIEVELERGERSERRTLIANAARLLRDGRPGAIVAIHDLTERRRAEEEREALRASLAQQDRLASMGMLAAGVAHEINNPLTFLLYNLEGLAHEVPGWIAPIARAREALDAAGLAHGLPGGPLLEDAAARLRDALDGGERIREISRALSTFSRAERAEPAPINVHHAIEHAITMAQNELKYRARLVRVFGHLPPLLASEGKIAQVMLNLLINAAHAIPEGDVEGNEVRVRTWAEDGRALIEVSDTGQGILPEHLPRIFEPFFTTKGVGVGSGLGLAISRSIIVSFGGEIGCTSEPGRGTRFRISLPACEEPARAAPAVAEAQVPAVRGRVLVIDDDPGVRASLVRMLGTLHEVVAAESGERARAILEADRGFDLILCDLMMPRVSGMDVHDWLSSVDPALAEQLVFITGGAFTPRARELLARVPNLRLEKPLEAKLVAGVVGAMVAARRAGR